MTSTIRRTLCLWAVFAWGGPGFCFAAGPAPATVAAPEYTNWVAACRRLPMNRDLGDRIAPQDRRPLRSFAEFSAVLEPFLELSRTGALARAGSWLGAVTPGLAFLDADRGYFDNTGVPFQPFAQRVVVPPGTRLFFHGDLHGDIHALLAYLETLNREGHLDGFRVARPEVRLVFMGDYTDRGKHGVEVLYTLMRLKLANPAQVILVRGNHEDLNLVSRYGFLAEASQKYGRELDVRRLVRLYDFLPVVLYVKCGTNVVECNHGGLEPGYDSRPLLAAPEGVLFHKLGRLEQKRWLGANAPWVASLPAVTRSALEDSLVDFEPHTPTSPTVLGFMWNDFSVTSGEPQFAIDPGRAFVYGGDAPRLRGWERAPGPDPGPVPGTPAFLGAESAHAPTHREPRNFPALAATGSRHACRSERADPPRLDRNHRRTVDP